MADKKISALTAMTAPAAADFLHVIDDNSGTYTNQKIVLTNLFNKIPTFIGMNSVETKTDSDTALSLTTAVSLLSGSQTTLADSTTTGQIKIICAIGVGSATDVDLTTTLGAGATYTFQTVGETLTIMWTGAAWAILSICGNAVVTNFTNLTSLDITAS